MRHHLLFSVLAFSLALGACGSGEMTITEYATEVEALVGDMTARFAGIDAEWTSQPPSVARAQEYWEARLEIRNDFLDGIGQLRPPEAVIDQHEAALAVFQRMTDADVALRDVVDEYDFIDDHWQWVDTPEGRAADAVLEDVFAFCRASQEEFDATEERESFEEMPWLPAQMKEVVRVAFGCPPS